MFHRLGEKFHKDWHYFWFWTLFSMINRCVHTYRIYLWFIGSVNFHHGRTFNLILHRISRKITEWVAGYLLILIIYQLSWIYSTIITCDIVKVQFSKLVVIFFKMISFLFNNFIQTIFETCDKWLKNCWFDNANCHFELQLWSQQWSEIVVYTLDLSKILTRNDCMDQYQERNGPIETTAILWGVAKTEKSSMERPI